MAPYVASVLAFTASTAVAVWRLRAGSARSIAPSLLLVVAAYVAMVTGRAMTDATASVAVVAIDLALVAVGMAATLRLLGGWQQPDHEDDGRDGDDEGSPAPGAPRGSDGERRDPWGDFDDARARWEQSADRAQVSSRGPSA